MPDQKVQMIKTPVSEADMTQAFVHAAKQLYGISLSKQQVAILMAQNDLETGNRNAMFNYNIGNIQHTDGDGFDYYIGGDKTKDSHGNWVPTHYKFRSYPSLIDAAKNYVRNLHDRGNGTVWQSILSADPVAFSKALKKTHYYEADEEDKIDPITGKIKPGYTSGIVARYDNFNKGNSYENSKPKVEFSPTSDFLAKITPLMDKFLSSISKIEYSNKFKKKALYKKHLPKYDFLIKVNSTDPCNSIEFARILCTALDEELFADALTYTDKKNIEVHCKIHGPKDICEQSILQLCEALSETFEIATKKIGGIIVNLNISSNKQSSYQKLDIKLAETNYRNFCLKFITPQGS